MAGNLEELVKVALLAPMGDPRDPHCIWGAPTILWGDPGIGKSGRIEQVGAACKLPVETVYLSTHQPEDISGVPMSTGKDEVRMVCPLGQVQDLIKAEKGVLFLDELSCARPAVQGAGLSVVYERRVAGKRLPGRVRVLAAANPAETAAGGWQLSAPMANRLLHLDVKCPSVDEWTAWLLGATADIAPVEHSEELIAGSWGDCWPKIAGTMAGFHRSSRDKLYKLPALGHKSRGRAWASPRSWFVVARVLATCEALGRPELGLELIDASVGDGNGAEWIEWVSKANLPDPAWALDNGWTPDKRRLDIAFAVYSSAVAFVLEKKDKTEQRQWAIKCWKLFHQPVLRDNLGDVCLDPARALMKAGYTTKAGPDVLAVARDVIARFGQQRLAEFVRNN